MSWSGCKIPRNLGLHPTIGSTITCCINIFKRGKLSSLKSPLSVALRNPQFVIGYRLGPFKGLIERGLIQVNDYIVNNDWISLTALLDSGGPYQLNWWKPLQVLHLQLSGRTARIWPLQHLKNYVRVNEQDAV